MQADENLSFGDFILNFISGCLCFLVFNAVFDVGWTNIIPKGDFNHVRCF